MSTGGVFTLITNTGVQDKLIMQTELLNKSLSNLKKDMMEKYKLCGGNATQHEFLSSISWMPSIQSIEKTHIVFVSNTFKPYVSMAKQYSRTEVYGGAPKLGNIFSFRFPQVGDFVNDAVVYVKMSGLRAQSSQDKVRYIDFLAHRMMKNVAFKVQNNEIDSYTADNYNANYQHRIMVDKRESYLRCIGQETPNAGFLTSDPSTDEVRHYRAFGDGAQTYKNEQPEIEMWIPLLFWFKDIKQSLPNFILPRDQTTIEITLESEDKLISIGNGGGSGNYSVPVITECALYANHIFVLPAMLAVYIGKYSMQLIRVHKTHAATLTKAEGEVKLDKLKFAIECLYVGFRPKVNLLNSQTWYRNTHITQVNMPIAIVTAGNVVKQNVATYYNEKQVLASVGLQAYGIDIFPMMPPSFFNNYIPFRYGDHTITSPSLGWLMFNFNFNPGEFQPSGYFNSTLSREFYLKYLSANTVVSGTAVPIIRSDNPVDLIVLADAINFIMYENNTMRLKYTT